MMHAAEENGRNHCILQQGCVKTYMSQYIHTNCYMPPFILNVVTMQEVFYLTNVSLCMLLCHVPGVDIAFAHVKKHNCRELRAQRGAEGDKGREEMVDTDGQPRGSVSFPSDCSGSDHL